MPRSAVERKRRRRATARAGSFAGAGPRALRVGALSLALLLVPACGEGPPSSSPNFLLYVVDTLRADSLGCYGNRVTRTPHVDALASEGILFENAFSSSSWTRASLASILTGLHPPRHRAERRRDPLPPDVVTLAELLSRRGYATAFATANPNTGSFFGFGRGFDQMIELYRRRRRGPVRSTEMIADSSKVTARAIEWLRGAPRPFFLAVLSIDPHAPYSPPSAFDRYGPPYSGPVDGGFASLARSDLDEADRERIRSLYQGEVSFNDASFGALVGHLRETGELDRTVVVFTSDHGEEFWEYGRRGHSKSLVDILIRVPLVIRLPDDGSGGRARREARSVQLVDLAPTLLELAGAPAPDGLDGRSLLAAPPAPATPALASLFLGRHHLRSAREARWKLVWDLNSDGLSLYDISRSERVPVDPTADPEAAAARDRLHRALLAMDRGVQPPAPQAEAPEIPAEVEEALRALGYIEEPEPDSPAD